jgi:hypothetical protein
VGDTSPGSGTAVVEQRAPPVPFDAFAQSLRFWLIFNHTEPQYEPETPSENTFAPALLIAPIFIQSDTVYEVPKLIAGAAT